MERLQLFRGEILEQLGALQIRQLESLGMGGRNAADGHELESRRRTLAVPAATTESTIDDALVALL